MKKYMYKSLIILILIATIVLAYPTKVFAISKMFRDADAFLGQGKDVEDVISTDQLKDVSRTFYKVFLAIAIVIAIIVGMVIGVKYIYEGAEGQAKLKEAFIPYIVGCLIVFSAFPIWKLAISFGNEQNMIKETFATDGSETKDSYNKVCNSPNMEDLTAFTDNEIEAAWTQVKIERFGESANETTDWQTVQRIGNKPKANDGYIFVEYAKRNYTNEQILNIWKKVKVKDWNNEDGWIGKLGEMAKRAQQN